MTQRSPPRTASMSIPLVVPNLIDWLLWGVRAAQLVGKFPIGHAWAGRHSLQYGVREVWHLQAATLSVPSRPRRAGVTMILTS